MIGNGSNPMRNRRRVLIGVFLAALVLVPVLEGAHDHGDLDRGAACVVCVVAHHAPASSATPFALDAPRIAPLEFTLAPLPPLTERRPSASTSRAPPASRDTIGA
jgi:hypothetical protein